MKRFKLFLGIITFFFISYCNLLCLHASDSKMSDAGFTSFMESIEIEIPECQTYDVPENSGFKSYMTYTLFTKQSNQYQLQTLCTTDSEGFRKMDDYYCIALGTFFDVEIGQRIDLELKNGQTIKCVLGDVKADCHTDSSNIFTTRNNCMSEFIVDTKYLNETVKQQGNVSYLPTEDWNSPVALVRIYDENILNS